ncbi:MAG: efflux RND transporter periplasmic adaptor subunit [Flavobacteriales bacterium]
MKRLIPINAIALAVVSCGNKDIIPDASGTFEATEITISSQANGRIEAFSIEEGQNLEIGRDIGYIDSTQLYLQKRELQANIKVLLSKRPDIATQLSALEERLRQAKREQNRVQNLLAGGAATQRQMDDANAQVRIIKSKIKAQNSTLSTTAQSLAEAINPIQIKIRRLNDKLEKCRIINNVKGTVLTRYAEAQETTLEGQPLYKIADLSRMILRAYITGDQLSHIKLNQEVSVRIDDTAADYKTYKGVIAWISDKAEFTPKTIQTKDERANLVYAVKIRVKNDGFLKIGMYGEVKF